MVVNITMKKYAVQGGVKIRKAAVDGWEVREWEFGDSKESYLSFTSRCAGANTSKNVIVELIIIS